MDGWLRSGNAGEVSTGYVHIGSAGSEAHLKFTGTQVRLLGAPTAGTASKSKSMVKSATTCIKQGKSPGLIWGTNVDAGAHSLVLRRKMASFDWMVPNVGKPFSQTFPSTLMGTMTTPGDVDAIKTPKGRSCCFQRGCTCDFAEENST